MAEAWRGTGVNAWGLRLVSTGLVLLVGMMVGYWVASGHFRAVVDTERHQLVSCKATSDHLANLAMEQGKALDEWGRAAAARQAGAEQAMSKARAGANLDYAAANRLQQERTGGEPCTAVTSIIDKELGL